MLRPPSSARAARRRPADIFPDPILPRSRMPIRSDHWIQKMAEEHGMIEPFEAGQVRDGCISYGLSSYGYDIRVAPDFKVFTNVHNVIVDPKRFDDRSFVTSPRMRASSRPTPSPWGAPSSTSASRGTRWWCAWASPRTRAAGSSST